jgi:CheY-like chemotaxis protein
MISVLAVDDNEIHCYAISRALRHRGYSVSTADCGEKALQVARLVKPDVVLLDVHLPDLSGFEVCRRLRDDPSTKGIAVLFHTASAANEVSRTFATQVGGDAFLTYPVDQDHLYSIIQGCLARRKPS